MRRLGSVLAGAVISAAFLGPGTVSTAGKAGAAYGYALLWALVFSTLACLVLQEASARLTIRSGLTLGQALRRRFSAGAGAMAVLVLVLGAVVVGCAAYEAGNILGGVAGAGLIFGGSRTALTLISGLAAAVVLWRGDTRWITAILGALVAVMGLGFLLTAVLLRPDIGAFLRGAAWPSLPAGSGLLALGLVGTTVVPYNLFLGSGLAEGRGLRDTRLGLVVAIGLGGLISMGVVVAGAAVAGEFGFAALADVLGQRLGGWSRGLFGLGLLAAGFSSAVTAPLAAAMTARSLFERRAADGTLEGRDWGPRSPAYRAVWMGVLAVGVGFGVSGVRPIPAIVAAQALNGLLLPIVALFLLLAVNDRRVMGSSVNSPLANVVAVPVVAVTLVLGLRGLAAAGATALGLAVSEGQLLSLAGVLALVLAWPVSRAIGRGRREGAG